MHLAPKRRPLRTTIAVSIAGVLAALTLGLTVPSCQLVEDTLLGVQLSGAHRHPRECFRECRKDRHDDRRDENDRHHRRLRDCRHDQVCIAVENARHESELLRIQAAFKACKDACHHQGEGDGDDDHDDD